MRIVLDTRPWEHAAGIGRYTRMLLSALGEGLGGHEVVALHELGPRWGSAEDEELELPALLEREGADLFYSPFFLLPAVLPRGTRSIVTLHDAIPAVRPELSSQGFRELFAEQAPDAARRAELVVCPTQFAKDEVCRALGVSPGRVRVLPEAPAACFRPRPVAEIEAACRQHGLSPGEYCLCVGSLEHRKGPDLILDAWVRVGAQAPSLLVAFAGPAGGFELQAEAERRALAGQVLALGHVSDEELAALYCGARALLFPSRHEGFGLPLLEAFACGTPVVASRATAIPEVAGDAALLVPPEDPDALAEAVLRIGSEAGLAERLRREGAARLEDWFTVQHIRRGLAELFAEIEALRAVPA